MGYSEEKQKERKREYYREWRKNHPESVVASQERYWLKKAAEIRNQEQAAAGDPGQQNG